MKRYYLAMLIFLRHNSCTKAATTGTPEVTENLWLGKMIFDIDTKSFQKAVLSLVFEAAFTFMLHPTSFT